MDEELIKDLIEIDKLVRGINERRDAQGNTDKGLVEIELAISSRLDAIKDICEIELTRIEKLEAEDKDYTESIVHLMEEQMRLENEHHEKVKAIQNDAIAELKKSRKEIMQSFTKRQKEAFSDDGQ